MNLPFLMPFGDAPLGERVEPLASTPEADVLLGFEATTNEDGSVDLAPPVAGEGEVDLRELPWDANLAEHLGDHVLAALATEVLDGVSADIESNQENYAVLEEGIAALGLKKERLQSPFPEAAGSRSSTPLKSAMRFNASAMGEMMPASGPVRTQVQGEANGIEGASQRKQKYLNHYLTAEDEGYYPDFDQGLFLLGVLGSIFRCVRRCPFTGKPLSRYRTPFDLVVSAHSSEAHGGGRFTEIDRLPASEIRRLQVVGYYLDVELGTPFESGEAANPSLKLRALEGRAQSSRYEDGEHTVYTQRIITEIAGLEHLDAEGEPSGLPLPWRVTVDNDSHQVLRVERDWRADDTSMRPRDHFSHMRYMPGLGFYGMGFAHILASPADATTTMIRQGLNANTLVSFPGGLRAKGSRIEQNATPIGPCEFREIDTAGMPIGNAVMPLPYRDVPPSFVPLLQAIQQEAEALGQVAEMQVGEGRQDAPVGTTLALIEQAVRVESAVIKRLHTAQRKELRLICEVLGKSDAVYPYHVAGQQGVPIAPDFANHHDILPVTDPNTPTQTQRLALAEAKLKLAQGAPPGMFDVRFAFVNILRVAGTSDEEIARLMPDQPQGQPSDPITEFAVALKGEPLAVDPMQQHAAHIASHMAQAQMPNLPPPVVQALVAHMGEHLAALYRQQAAAMLGVPALPPGAPMPPVLEGQFAQVAGQLTAQMAPLLQGPGEGKGGEDPALKQAELALKREELAFKDRDGARKIELARQQDRGEMLRAAMVADDQQADRDLAYAELGQERELAHLEAATDAAARRHASAEGSATREHTTRERVAGMAAAPAKKDAR